MAAHPEPWRDLDPWDKARLRWTLQTSLHPHDPRPNQVTPPGDWLIWLILAGRGFGKTRTGAEDVSDYARTHPGHRIAVVAGDYSEARDVCIEGDSGILSCVPSEAVQSWNRSLGELIFVNGARVDLYSAEKPGALRGPQHHRAWVDELAKWRYLETWDQLMFGLRLGQNPQVVVTTTPKPIPLLMDLVERPTTVVTRGSTFENERNLAPAALAELRSRYEGTRLGRQELYAELLADFEGALWRREVIEQSRVNSLADVPQLSRIAVGIDPSTWGPAAGSDGRDDTGHGVETGIIVAGITPDLNVYVLDDLSCRKAPHEWAQVAVDAYHNRHATAIVPELNAGGAMVTSTIHLIDSTARVDGVRAAQGKRARAEPVAALYEQGRVHHVGRFADLEDQCCSWDPRENYSPDRIDALVWAITWLAPWAPSGGGTSAAVTEHLRPLKRY